MPRAPSCSLWAAATTLAVMGTGCGAMLQTAIGFDEKQERRAVRVHRVQLQGLPADATVEREGADGRLALGAARDDTVAFTVVEEVAVPKSKAPLLIGAGIDVLGAAGGVIAATQIDAQRNDLLFTTALYTAFYFGSAAIADLVFGIIFAGDETVDVIRYEPVKDQRVTYVATAGDRVQRREVQVPWTSAVQFDFARRPARAADPPPGAVTLGTWPLAPDKPSVTRTSTVGAEPGGPRVALEHSGTTASDRQAGPSLGADLNGPPSPEDRDAPFSNRDVGASRGATQNGQPFLEPSLPPPAPPRVESRAPPPPPPPERWYGWQIIAPDVLSIAAFIEGARTDNKGLWIGGLTTFLVAPPLIHFANGQFARGGGSFAVRFGGPAVVGAAGTLIGVFSVFIDPCTEFCPLGRGVIGFAIGAGAAAVAAPILDIAFLAWAPGEPEESDSSPLALLPGLGTTDRGEMTFGLMGQF